MGGDVLFRRVRPASPGLCCRKSDAAGSLKFYREHNGDRTRIRRRRATLGRQMCLRFFIKLSRSHMQLCTNTVRQLSRKEKWADGADNLWVLVLIIKEKEGLFISKPQGSNIKPITSWFVT